MNIVTIMNYKWDDINHSAMCLAWVRQAKIWLTNRDTVIIITKKKLPQFLEDEMNISKTAKFKQMIRCDLPEFNKNVPNVYIEMLRSKLYIMTQLGFPFLFIDADAMIVGDLTPLERVFDTNMPIVAIDHETDIPNHTESLPPFINSGVILINDPQSEMLNWDKMIEYAEKCNFTFRFVLSGTVIPGNDQALIYSYCAHNRYDYHHPLMGIKYNTCAGKLIKTVKENDKWVAYSNCGKVKIFHYWWNFKPWKDVKCPLFDEVKEDFMRNIFPLMEKKV